MVIDKWFASRRRKTAAPSPGERSDLDIFLGWALQAAASQHAIRFPLEYLGFLRDCLERKSMAVREIRPCSGTPDTASKRFASLVDALANPPPIEITVAEKIARAADALRGDMSALETDHWAGDVRAHFEMSSSFGAKGRILAAIVRYMRGAHCLELGTAYGMSARFLLEALAAHGPDTHLTTVEGSEAQFAMASDGLNREYGGRVTCVYGWTSQILPGLVRTLGPVDFLFHDAGHSRRDYLHDFNAVLPSLAAGAVALFDDIRWSDPRFYKGNPQCYRGWRELAGHSRVRQAIEIDNADLDSPMGLLLLGD